MTFAPIATCCRGFDTTLAHNSYARSRVVVLAIFNFRSTGFWCIIPQSKTELRRESAPLSPDRKSPCQEALITSDGRQDASCFFHFFPHSAHLPYLHFRYSSGHWIMTVSSPRTASTLVAFFSLFSRLQGQKRSLRGTTSYTT